MVTRYFLTIIDEYSRYTQTHPMKSKREASELLLNFIKRFEKQTGHTVTKVHGDNGTEFSRAYEFLDKEGVDISTSTSYTPESNGLVQRTHGVLLSMVRSCMIQSRLDKSYWNYALRHVTECRNLVPHISTGQAPYEVVYRQLSPNLRSRVQSGLTMFHEGGAVYHMLTPDGTVRTKHVTFRERQFPGTKVWNEDKVLDKPESDTDDSSEPSEPSVEISISESDNSIESSDTKSSSKSEDSSEEDDDDEDDYQHDEYMTTI